MSEEEIIKDVKDFNNITVLYGQLVLLKSQLTRYQKASNNLLDLYNKEKEKNKDFKDIEQKICNEVLIDTSSKEFKDKYISKYKLREIIKGLDKSVTEPDKVSYFAHLTIR